MTVFADTSGLYALISAADANHEAAKAAWLPLRQRRERLMTSNYVLVEATALIASRLGFGAVRAFQTDFVPVLRVEWVDESVHRHALAAFLTAGRRNLSLVDCVSFEIMRRLEVDTAFAFDAHFLEQGFRTIPQSDDVPSPSA